MSETEPRRDIHKRLVIADAAIPFVARGGYVFSGQVINSDPEIKEGEVVQIVDKREHHLGVAQFFTGQ